MCTAFPCSDYYGPSAPSRRHQPTVDLPADQLAAGREGRPRNGSHVHHVPVDRIGAQLCPCSLANGYAAGIHRGLPTDVNGRLRSRLARAYSSTRTAARPASTRLEPVPRLRGFNRWFNRYACLSRLPDPHHLAVLTRPVVVRAASRPPQHLLGQAALSFTGLLRQPGAAGLSPAAGYMAPRGAPGRRGTGRRPGWRRAASCRTPPGTSPTDPASPTRFAGPPRLGAGGEPGARLGAVAARHDVEEPTAPDVDDRGRPPLACATARPARTTSRPTRPRSDSPMRSGSSSTRAVP